MVTLGYTDEGVECYISLDPFQGGVALYRLYYAAENSHFYTTSTAERDNKIVQSYELEGTPDGIIGYIYQDSTEGMLPPHRLKQSDASNTLYHFLLTTSQHDRSTTIDSGYTENDPDGIGYVPLTAIKEWDAHHRPQANFGGVDLATGAFRGLNITDLIMKGRGPSLAFSHYYSSFYFNHAPMGIWWSHSLCSTIVESPDGNKVFAFWAMEPPPSSLKMAPARVSTRTNPEITKFCQKSMAV